MNDGFRVTCNVDNDCNNTIIAPPYLCENGFCVMDSYAFEPLRATYLNQDGSAQRLFTILDGSGTIARPIDLEDLSYPQISGEESTATVNTLPLNESIVLDVTVVLDMSSSCGLTNEDAQRFVNGIANAMFAEGRATTEFISVYAFAGMPEPVELIRYQTNLRQLGEVVTELDATLITDPLSTDVHQTLVQVVETIAHTLDTAPNEFGAATAIFPIVYFLTDAVDTASRVNAITALSASLDEIDRNGFVYAVNCSLDLNQASLNQMSKSAQFDYEALFEYIDQVQPGGSDNRYEQLGFHLGELPFQRLTNMGIANVCPSERGDGILTTLSHVNDTTLAISTDFSLDEPECANTNGGRIQSTADLNRAPDLKCINGLGQYHLCGYASGHYCGECPGANYVMDLTQGNTFRPITDFIIRTNELEQATISFSSVGSETIGFRAFARQGTPAGTTPASYSYYAPEAVLVRNRDDCAECDEFTYVWNQPCSQNIDLVIDEIRPTDQWYVRLQACEVFVPEPDDGRPENTFTPQVIRPFEEDQVYAVRVSVAGGGLGGGAIAGIAIGATAGALLLAGGMIFCCIKARE
jgi:hypothetical protein